MKTGFIRGINSMYLYPSSRSTYILLQWKTSFLWSSRHGNISEDVWYYQWKISITKRQQKL